MLTLNTGDKTQTVPSSKGCQHCRLRRQRETAQQTFGKTEKAFGKTLEQYLSTIDVPHLAECRHCILIHAQILLVTDVHNAPTHDGLVQRLESWVEIMA